MVSTPQKSNPVSSIMLEDTEGADVQVRPSSESHRELTWQERIQELYFSGGSDVEVCKLFKWKKATFEKNYNNNSGFRDIVDIGRVMAQAYFLEEGRKNIRNNKFNTTLYGLIMKNRFGWAEKVDNSGISFSKDESPEELKAKFAGLLPELMKEMLPGLSHEDVAAMLHGESDEG